MWLQPADNCWTSTSPAHLQAAARLSTWRLKPNKTHLFTRHCAALHTVPQCIKEGVKGLPGQMLLARRHDADHRPVRLLHGGRARSGTERTQTGEKQQQQSGAKHLQNFI